MNDEGCEIDQAAFDDWLAGQDGRRVFETCGSILFEEEPDMQRQARFLIGALRIAFRNGFVAGRSSARLNGCAVVDRRNAPDIPF
jgi:hypothetical protein